MFASIWLSYPDMEKISNNSRSFLDILASSALYESRIVGIALKS